MVPRGVFRDGNLDQLRRPGKVPDLQTNKLPAPARAEFDPPGASKLLPALSPAGGRLRNPGRPS